MNKFDTLVNQLLSEMVDYTPMIEDYADEVYDIYLAMRESGEISSVWPGDLRGMRKALTRWISQWPLWRGPQPPPSIISDTGKLLQQKINEHN